MQLSLVYTLTILLLLLIAMKRLPLIKSVLTKAQVRVKLRQDLPSLLYFCH